MSFTKQQRVEQLKACAETIKNNAERIIVDNEFSMEWKIIISIKPREVPTITTKRKFVSPEIIQSMQ